MRQSGDKTLVESVFEDNKSDSLILSRSHRPDYQIVLFMGLLMLIGLVVIYAIGPQRANVLNNAYGSDYSQTYFFFKQAASLFASLIAFGVMSVISLKFLTKNAYILLIISLVLCSLLAIAGFLNLDIAQKSLGATRWLNLGILGSFQPSEALKFALLIYVSMFLGNKLKQGRLNNFKESLLPLAIIYFISIIFVVVIQKDLGTGIALTSIILCILLVGKINIKNTLIIIGALLLMGLAAVATSPHRVERILTFFKGDSSAAYINDDNNYHVEHAKLAIGSGGLFGVGIGNSVQATGYLPESINDSVFAIIGETFGFIGLSVILALFMSLLLRILKIMDCLQDTRLRLLTAGVFGWLGSHVMLNIASMIGLVPLTGITLPLLSLGGTSMLFISSALGLVFQLSKYTVHSSKLKEMHHEDFSSRRRIGGSRNSSRSRFGRN
ncbi:MAG: FtsW/RodA/SpoVE family cell cycle protein [Candidatus Saccharibacteria bacterium]